jgi:hypothetical protein
LPEGAGFGHGVVIAEDREVDVLELDVAAGVQVAVFRLASSVDRRGNVLEGLAVEAWPVLEGAGHHHAVDVVEFLGEIPVVF